MTLAETYYALNTAVNVFLKAQGETARLFAFGINPQQQQARVNKPKYPYFQSYYPTNIERPPHTTKQSAIITWFDYPVNFYAAPVNEQYNAAALIALFEKFMNGVQDTRVQIWRDIASLQRIVGPVDIAQRGGSVQIAFATTFRLAAVCSYALDITPYVPSTVDSAVAMVDAALTGEYD